MICAAEFNMVFHVAGFAFLCHWCQAAHLSGASSHRAAGEGIRGQGLLFGHHGMLTWAAQTFSSFVVFLNISADLEVG